jgi:hypothetical protein
MQRAGFTPGRGVETTDHDDRDPAEGRIEAARALEGELRDVNAGDSHAFGSTALV